MLQLARRRLPEPPEALRRGPFRPRPASQGLHEPRTAALLGRATGAALAVCFVTGFVSHLHQHPPAWLDVPARPVWGYQLTQGLHVATGIAAIPLVLAKLWTVYPRLFAWPPLRDLGHAAERLLILPLVAGTLFEVASGLLNIVQWYPWRFFFPRVHWAVAWVVMGALLVHLAVKAPLVRASVGRHRPRPPLPGADPGQEEASQEVLRRDRRALLLGAGAGAAAVTLATVGQTVAPLRGLSVLASREPGRGQRGLPINRTARAAGVRAAATDPAWRLQVLSSRPGSPVLSLSLAELAALPRHDAVLPIACVEGWSASARWSGVRLRDVLALAGIPAGSRLQVVSLETGWLYARSPVGPSVAADPLTLLAMAVDGEPLTLDHGYPLRLIAPGRPGVQQTKWLSRIEEVPG